MIIDDDINYIKYLINNVISEFENIRVSYIATNGKEAIDILQKSNFDLILIDLKMPNISGIDVIERIKVMNLIKTPKIIVVSGEVDLIYCIKNNYLISDIVEKTSSVTTVKNKLDNIVNSMQLFEKAEYAKEEIIHELLRIGYNFKHKGTQYIYEAIIYIYKRNNMDLIDNLENNVYRYIAKKHNKSILNIKINIINSTKLISEKNDNITPKHVISKILIKLYKKVLI